MTAAVQLPLSSRRLGGTRLSPHELVGEQPVVGFQLLLRLEQPGFDIEQFCIFEPGLAHGQRARSDLADVLERQGEMPLVELRKALLQYRQRLDRTIE